MNPLTEIEQRRVRLMQTSVTDLVEMVQTVDMVLAQVAQERDQARAALAERDREIERLRAQRQAALENAEGALADNKRLRGLARQLAEGLRDMRSVCFDRRDALSEFERLGDLYYRATGHLRPGKDDPFEYSNSAENNERYEQWSRDRTEKAFDSVDTLITEARKEGLIS